MEPFDWVCCHLLKNRLAIVVASDGLGKLGVVKPDLTTIAYYRFYESVKQFEGGFHC
jgi:hypothetical protein